MPSLSQNWKVREEITKYFDHQFVLYASQLGKDTANITFHLDPKPVKKITTTRSERHLKPEEKMESSQWGRMGEGNERWMMDVWEQIETAAWFILSGKKISAVALRGEVLFEVQSWNRIWPPGCIQLRIMEGQESKSETRTLCCTNSRTFKRRIKGRCHRLSQLLSLSLSLAPSVISAWRRKWRVGVREHARWKQAVDAWMRKSGWKPRCGPSLWERRNFNRKRGTNDQRALLRSEGFEKGWARWQKQWSSSNLTCTFE